MDLDFPDVRVSIPLEIAPTRDGRGWVVSLGGEPLFEVDSTQSIRERIEGEPGQAPTGIFGKDVPPPLRWPSGR